jgi:hypothetical protein
MDKQGALFLAAVIALPGLGLLLRGHGKDDLIYLLGGGFLLLAGASVGIFGLLDRLVIWTKAPPVQGRYWKLLPAAFVLMLFGLDLTCAEDGFGIRWLGIAGLLLFLPFFVASLVLVFWVIPSEIWRSIRSKRF